MLPPHRLGRLRSSTALCVRALLGAALVASVPACREITASRRSSDLTVQQTSPAYLFYMAPGDSVDTAWQESYHRWMVAALRIDPGVRLEYHKYRDRKHLREITDRETNGFAEPGTPRLHTIWPRDNHEVVHAAVILTLGHPPALFNEGIAVAHQTDPPAGSLHPRWNGESVHAIAARLDQAGRLPALGSMLESRDFFEYGEDTSYPMSGSWVRFLIDRYGLTPLKAYFRQSRFGAPAPETRAAFQAAYGITLEAAWAEWRSYLRGQ